MPPAAPRREFLQRSAWLALAALGVTARAAEPAPARKRSRLRTSLNAYSFYVELNLGLKEPAHPKAMSLGQLLDFAAEVEGWMADDFRECAEYAAKQGIFLGVQNHGDFLTTGAEHVSLLRRVNHPNCRAIVDTGKYLTDDPYVDIALAAPFAVNWQVKETPFGKPNKPLTDMRKIVQIARDAGYNGYLPIESLPMGRKNYDTPGELRRMLKELQAAIAE